MPPTPQPDLHVLSILLANADCVPPIQSWISEHLDTTPIELSKPNDPRIILDVYFDEEVDAHLAGHALFNETGHTNWTVRPCPARDWTEFWKRHFPPLDIGSSFRVCPPWESEAPNPESREVIVINPGMSFGTGNHFTTRFCLESLEKLMPTVDAPRVLDAGTGSGLLAIAAARRGASRVLGVDIDNTALEYAAENLTINQAPDQADITECIELRQVDLTTERISETFDLVFANLYGHLLISIADRLAALAAPSPDSRLILSGIRTVEGDLVALAFADQGWNEIARDAGPEWSGMILAPESDE